MTETSVLGPSEFAGVVARTPLPVLDLRPLAFFLRAHVPGAIHTPYTPAGFAKTVRDALAPGPLALVDDIPAITKRAAGELQAAGFSIAATLTGGTKAWQAEGYALEALEQTTAEQLSHQLLDSEEKSIHVLDVREPFELQGGKIKEAENVPMGSLAGAVPGFDKTSTYVLVCATGVRSAVAQAYLHRHGFANVKNLVGGMALWQECGLPVTR